MVPYRSTTKVNQSKTTIKYFDPLQTHKYHTCTHTPWTINYAKTERLTSKKDGRVLEFFKLEIKDNTEAEALITENLTCPIKGIIYRVEDIRTPISIEQCWNCQSFGHSAKTCRSKTKWLICGEGHHHKGCPDREKKQPTVKNECECECWQGVLMPR